RRHTGREQRRAAAVQAQGERVRRRRRAADGHADRHRAGDDRAVGGPGKGCDRQSGFGGPALGLIHDAGAAVRVDVAVRCHVGDEQRIVSGQQLIAVTELERFDEVEVLPGALGQKTSGFSSLPEGGALNLPWKPMKTPLFTYGGNAGGAKTMPDGPSLSAPSAPLGSPGSGHVPHGSGRNVTSGCPAPLPTRWPVWESVQSFGNLKSGTMRPRSAVTTRLSSSALSGSSRVCSPSMPLSSKYRSPVAG